MKSLRFNLTLVLFAALVGCTTTPAGKRAPASTNDLLFRGGRIETLGRHAAPATALVVHDGKILFIGSDADAEARASGGAKVVELAGATVLPAFIDAHIHPIDSGVEFAECYLYNVDTLDAIIEKVRHCVATAQTGWLRGSGWAQTLFESVPLSENPLDHVETTGPIALESSDGHSYWVNHVALELAGITSHTPDPRDGVIGRKPGSLEPNGFLYEGAMDFIDHLMPKRTIEEQRRGLAKALSLMRESGISSFQDAYVTEDHLRVYSAMIAAGEFPGLVATAMYADSNLPVASQMKKFRRLRHEYSGEHLRVGTVKIFLDGTREDHTAALLKPYLRIRGRHVEPVYGKIQWPREKLNQMVELADRHGFQVHFHAIGDAAVRAALDAIERAQTINHTGNHRHQIAHLEVVDPEDIPRFARLGVIARAGGDTWTPEQRIPVEGAIVGYTSGAAYANFWENRTGALRTGLRADLVILNHDPLDTERDRLSMIKVLATYSEGKCVFPTPNP